ncbi:MAG: hypothetical protein FWD15_00390 [Alphaproteobacteria bacterium]|nr:hypothetical protein [Alphaproteobacteria bacterium]
MRTLDIYSAIKDFISASPREIQTPGAMVKDIAKAINDISANADKIDDEALSLTASLLWISAIKKNGYKIAAAGAAAKNLFPFAPDLKIATFAKAIDIATGIANDSSIIAFVPLKGSRDIWWSNMLLPDAAVKVIAKLGAPGTESYLIANEPKAFGFDRSIIVVKTDKTLSANDLTTTLHKLKIPIYRITSQTALVDGSVAHVVEISHPIKSANAGIFKLKDEIGGVKLKVSGYLGGYSEPCTQKTEILKFKVA